MAFGLLVAHDIKPDKQSRYMNDFDRPWNLPGECHKQWDMPECNIAAQQLSVI